MDTLLPKHDIVLLGAGHTNAHILRMWRMKPIPTARLTCVSNFPVATYSGMLPGVLAGLYKPEAMQIDLVRLCASAGVRFISSNVTRIDADQRQLSFADRPPLLFDTLAIGIGSVPDRSAVDACDDTVLAIKPMQTFLDRLESRVRECAAEHGEEPIRIAIVGGGAGGVEIALCLPDRIRKILGNRGCRLTLVDAKSRLVQGMRDKTAHLLESELRSRDVDVRLGKRVRRICSGTLTLDDDSTLEADIVLWATGAVAPPLLANCDLPKDDRGFLLTRSTLQTVAHDAIFAVGDSGTLEDQRTPKAGVYAVRQGPVLWDNLGRVVRGESLAPFRPQSNFLKLLNLGNGSAVAEHHGTTWRGRWCWRIKDRIDRRFMAMYQDYQPMKTTLFTTDAPEMRCAGCGGKVGGDVLSRVLKRLAIHNNRHVVVGLDAPDDVAVLRGDDGSDICATTDFFAAPLDDAYTVGRIAALNAVSDVFAVAGQPTAALAHVTLPVGPSDKQEQLLFELLAGALREFDASQTSIVGGHTIEGPQLAIGFTVLGQVARTGAHMKDGLRPGDALVLTKPLGSGVLLAAHMQARCRALWMQWLLTAMLTSNQYAASLVDEYAIGGVTDVTGFGFAGHLLEMLNASNLAAEIALDQLPLLPGTAALIRSGIESTLAPANRAAESEVEIHESARHDPAFAAMFDPQTSGGLLLGVDPNKVEKLLKQLVAQSGLNAAVVGHVASATANRRRIVVT